MAADSSDGSIDSQVSYHWPPDADGRSETVQQAPSGTARRGSLAAASHRPASSHGDSSRRTSPLSACSGAGAGGASSRNSLDVAAGRRASHDDRTPFELGSTQVAPTLSASNAMLGERFGQPFGTSPSHHSGGKDAPCFGGLSGAIAGRGSAHNLGAQHRSASSKVGGFLAPPGASGATPPRSRQTSLLDLPEPPLGLPATTTTTSGTSIGVQAGGAIPGTSTCDLLGAVPCRAASGFSFDRQPANSVGPSDHQTPSGALSATSRGPSDFNTTGLGAERSIVGGQACWRSDRFHRYSTTSVAAPLARTGYGCGRSGRVPGAGSRAGSNDHAALRGNSRAHHYAIQLEQFYTAVFHAAVQRQDPAASMLLQERLERIPHVLARFGSFEDDLFKLLRHKYASPDYQFDMYPA